MLPSNMYVTKLKWKQNFPTMNNLFKFNEPVLKPGIPE